MQMVSTQFLKVESSGACTKTTQCLRTEVIFGTPYIYYDRFLPNLASTLASLYRLLKASTYWHWSSKQDEAFETSKKLLTSFQLLVHFDPHKKLVLSCDALAYGIEAVLPHKFPDGSEQPIVTINISS